MAVRFTILTVWTKLILKGLHMSLLEDNLIAALKELYETSKSMTSGRFSADDMERYRKALIWAERVLKSAGGKIQ
jgi:hypothetical protein